jgi:hypothetical protein
LEVFSDYSLAEVSREIDVDSLVSQRLATAACGKCSPNVASSFSASSGKDCNLRRWGHGLMLRGGKNAKKRAVVAVARKLAVLLHALLVSDKPDDPFYKQSVIAT